MPDPSPIRDGRVILMTAHSKSIKGRWEDHFTLQLKSQGFTVIAPTPEARLNANVGDIRNVFQQYRFHPDRKWSLDFAIPAIKLAIEIEGGIWMRGGGAHSRPANIQRDVEKGNALAMLGWRLLRFTPQEIKSGESIQMTAELALR